MVLWKLRRIAIRGLKTYKKGDAIKKEGDKAKIEMFLNRCFYHLEELNILICLDFLVEN